MWGCLLWIILLLAILIAVVELISSYWLLFLAIILTVVIYKKFNNPNKHIKRSKYFSYQTIETYDNLSAAKCKMCEKYTIELTDGYCNDCYTHRPLKTDL